MELLTPGISVTWIAAVLLLIPFILMVWALADISSGSLPEEKKAVWAISVLAVPLAGSILYFIMGKKER